jgi:hypothetical protein
MTDPLSRIASAAFQTGSPSLSFPSFGDLGSALAKSALLKAANNSTVQRLASLLARAGNFIEPPYWDVETWVSGGISPRKALEMYRERSQVTFARKNLWYVEIIDGNPPDGFAGVAGGINLFATAVEYGPYTLTGDVTRIGSGQMDGLHAGERVEMRITTMDDDVGRIKRWVRAKAGQMTLEDGTFGTPSEYVVTIKVVHMDVLGDRGFGYEESFGMRLAGIDLSLARSEQAMEEFTVSFVQFDTFMGRAV